MNLQRLLIISACAVAWVQSARAQVSPPPVFEMDVENVVRYYEDTADSTKFGKTDGIVPAAVAANFQTYILIGDIVAINGQPVRGTVSHTARWTNLSPTPKPGESIADMVRGGLGQWAFEILNLDGSPIGSLFLNGMHGGTPTPGSPLQVTQGNNTITGGTGAYFGVRGDFGQQVTPQTVSVRPASITENPALRRVNGGGKIRWVFRVIPMLVPQIVVAPSGPVLFHADFSPVTAAKPGKAGEILIMQAAGLGATLPAVAAGAPFPADPLRQVSSPISITIDGQKAEVINSVGWPGLVDIFRVDFRVPADMKSGSTLQIACAFIPGPSIKMPAQ